MLIQPKNLGAGVKVLYTYLHVLVMDMDGVGGGEVVKKVPTLPLTGVGQSRP